MLKIDMIRKINKNDIEKVMHIWLSSNLKAHYFINPKYWTDNFDYVRSQIEKSQVYVYDDGEIKGFIGLNKEYIEGIFVEEAFKRHGIGKALLNYAKNIKTSLTLSVYEKNAPAIEFYKAMGFCTAKNNLDTNTNENEIIMHWKSKKL